MKNKKKTVGYRFTTNIANETIHDLVHDFKQINCYYYFAPSDKHVHIYKTEKSRI